MIFPKPSSLPTELLNPTVILDIDSVLTEPVQNRQLYTPAMLAELLGISVRTVRRWQRAGFLIAATEVMQLPYFDYASLAIARQLSKWMEQGATTQSIQTQLDALRQRAGSEIPLQELPVSAEGKRLILRQGDRFIEASGQLRFGFDATEEHGSRSPSIAIQFQSSAPNSELSQRRLPDTSHLDREEMIDEAIAAEDADELDAAIEWYRSALAAHGPDANICFQLAELLYRQGDTLAARERYYMALELNSELVEARANLGCVLAECNQLDLAIAAFEGALEQFSDYADVHFHLARVLEETGDLGRAAEHWQSFLELAPASPWAEEAQERLHHSGPRLDF